MGFAYGARKGYFMKKIRSKINFGYIFLATIPLFAVIYTILPADYFDYGLLNNNFAINLYFSAITITTLGYGDIVPLNEAAAVLVGMESVLGVVIAGLFLNQIAYNRMEKEKESDGIKQATRAKLRESDKLLQFAAVIKRTEDFEELKTAVRDFILNIDMHDYRVLERICLIFLSDEDLPKFREAFRKEMNEIEAEYNEMKSSLDGAYWG